MKMTSEPTNKRPARYRIFEDLGEMIEGLENDLRDLEHSELRGVKEWNASKKQILKELEWCSKGRSLLITSPAYTY